MNFFKYTDFFSARESLSSLSLRERERDKWPVFSRIPKRNMSIIPKE